MGAKLSFKGDNYDDIQRCLHCKRTECVNCLHEKRVNSRTGRCIEVKQIDPDTKQPIAVFFSLTEAAEKTGISRTSISKCIRKKAKTAGGFYWEVS